MWLSFWLPNGRSVVTYFLQNNPVDGDAREVAGDIFQVENRMLREYQTEASTLFNDLLRQHDICPTS